MAKQPLKADELLIGSTTNLIGRHVDGDMVFRDAFIPEVKLKDLIGGSVVIEPAIIVGIGISDWSEYTVESQTRYSVTIPHTYTINTNPLLQVTCYTLSNELITLNKVIINSNNIFLESTIKINVKIVIKKL
jgi:hypothetical protein